MASKSIDFRQNNDHLNSLDPEQDSDLSSLMFPLSFDRDSEDECKMSSPSSSSDDLSMYEGDRTPSPSLSSDDLSMDGGSRTPSPASLEDDRFTTPPPSPRDHHPQNKITPERMKKFCLKASKKPPQPSLFKDGGAIKEPSPLRSHWATHGWIHAHQENVKKGVQEVISTVRYVTHDAFIKQLSVSVDHANFHLAGLYGSSYKPGMNCIVLTQEGKSNLWVAELARQYFRFNAERYMDLGLNDADQFVRMLQGVSKNIKIVREKFKNRTIVLFDDASYSGKQMSSHLLQVRRAVQKYSLLIKRIVVIVPFATSFAQKAIQKASTVPVGKTGVYISPTVALPMLSDLTPDVYDLIINLWYKGKRKAAEKIGLAYFQHKVPNDQSFPGALAKGSVYHLSESGKSKSQKNSYSFIKDVIPDYKGTIAKRFPSCRT